MTVRIRPGAVTEIVIDVPRTRNALSIAVLDGLAAGIRDASERDDVRVVVLSGAAGGFSSGADLKEEASPDASIASVRGLYHAIAASPKPVIARVEGHCLGLAVGVAAACDLSVAAEEARFVLPEPRMGQAPTLAALTIVPRLRRGDASRLLLTSAPFDGRHAQEIGLVDHSVPAAMIMAATADWIEQILASAPGALATCKRLVRELPQLEQMQAWALAGELTAERAASMEALEGRAAANERRPPSWALAFDMYAGDGDVRAPDDETTGEGS